MTQKDRKTVVYFDCGDETIETTLGEIQDTLEEYGFTIAKLYDIESKN